MKAVVFKGVGEIALEEVPDPSIQDPKDVVVRITRSAICGTDLHLVRGTLADVQVGTVLGHEAIGIIEEIGKDVKTLKVGDRVIIPSTIGCGTCHYCSRGIYSQCDNANPNGPDAGTAFYGGPKTTGPFNGLQAERARLAFADACLLKVPDNLTDDQVILLSDILPTACMAVDLADVTTHDTVAVFGCGPVGQLVIACLKQLKVKHIFAIDCVPSRLSMAQKQGAHVINFNDTGVVSELKKLTNQRGPTKIIDAVGVDAEQPQCCGLQYFKGLVKRRHLSKEVKEVAPKTNPHDGNWYPGNGPSQVSQWAIEAIAKAGTYSIIGVYPPLMEHFPIGAAMNKNLTLKMGNCNHRQYLPTLIDWVKTGAFDLLPFITQKVPFEEVITAYKYFDKREDNWIKVILTF
jgi:threonine dehydrogenase-like Zn-dependent dehydrogenase